MTHDDCMVSDGRSGVDPTIICFIMLASIKKGLPADTGNRSTWGFYSYLQNVTLRILIHGDMEPKIVLKNNQGK